MESQCRLCAGSFNFNLIQIFDESGNKLKLQERIINRLHIYVDEYDFLPKAICIICYGQLDRFETFMRDVHKIQNTLLKLAHEEGTAVTESSTTDTEITNKNEIPIIEVDSDSDISFLENDDGDSDVEFIETDVKPLSQQLRYFSDMENFENQKEDIFQAVDIKIEGDLSNSNCIESKPKVLNGKVINHKMIQVGNSLAEDNDKMQTEYAKKYPIDNNILMETTQVQGKGMFISEDNDCDKGCQIVITSRLKQYSRAQPMKWSREQRDLMEQYFPLQFLQRTMPDMKLILDFIAQVGSVFDNVTPMQVKRYFCNRKYRYRSTKKQ